MLKRNTLIKLVLVAALLVSVMGVAMTQDEASLTVSFPGNTASPAINELIDGFIAMKAEQGITVDLTRNEPTEGYEDQLLLDFSADVGPDVFAISPERIPELVESDLLMPLDDLVAEWDEWDNFPQGMKDMPSMNGSLYAIMYNTDTRILFYRKDVFEAAGLDVPFEPTSWADIYAAADAILENTEAIPLEINSGTIWGEGTSMEGFMMLFRGAGGMLIDPEDGKWIVESPALLDAFTFYETVFSSGYSEAEPYLEPEPWVFWLQEGLANGDVGMAINLSIVWGLYGADGPWTIENRDDVLAWTAMPAREPGAGMNGLDYVGVGGGWGWAMSNSSDNTELAWEFIQYMTNAESVTAYNNFSGGIPSRVDATADDEFIGQLFESVLPYQSFRPQSTEWARVSEQIQIATEKILLGESAEDVLAQFAEAVEEIVGSDNVKRLPMD